MCSHRTSAAEKKPYYKPVPNALPVKAVTKASAPIQPLDCCCTFCGCPGGSLHLSVLSNIRMQVSEDRRPCEPCCFCDQTFNDCKVGKAFNPQQCCPSPDLPLSKIVEASKNETQHACFAWYSSSKPDPNP